MRVSTLGKSALPAIATAWCLAVPQAFTVADERATPEARFALADLNEDGVLTGKERQAGAPYDDLDGDGVTSRAEFIARRNEETRVLAEVVAAREADEAFRRADITEDGLLSGKERAGVEPFDGDGDGRITLAEFRTGRSARPGPDARRDPDGIGLSFTAGGGVGLGGAAGGTTPRKAADAAQAGAGPQSVAGPEAEKHAEEARRWFRDLDGNEDQRLTGTERLGSEDFDGDDDGRIVIGEFLAGVERLRAAEKKTTNPTAGAEPVGPQPSIPAPSELVERFDAGKVYLRLMGVSTYTDRSLACGTPDMRRIELTLQNVSIVDGWSGVVFADDTEQTKSFATKRNITALLLHEATVAKPSDRGVFYFSGCVATASETTYLCPTDYDRSRPEAAGIPFDEVARLLASFQAGRKLLVLDLHPYDAATTPDDVEAAAERAFAYVPNLATLVSCIEVDSQATAGPFAPVAAEALAGGADFNRDEIVDHDEWLAYHRIAMPWEAAKAGAAPSRPPKRVIGSGEIGNFGCVRTKPRPAEAGPVAAEVKIAQDLVNEIIQNLKKATPPRELTNSIGMKLIYVPAGDGVVGSPDIQPGRRQDESFVGTRRTRSFYLGAHEVTQLQFRRVMGSNPSHFQTADGLSDSLPVEQVTWDEAAEFCRRLSRSPVERLAGRSYRLPTECEWEYGCGGGTGESPFYCGATITSEDANIRGDRPYENSPFSRFLGRTAPVGSYRSNPGGLFDMHGNVAEWCDDWYVPGRFFGLPAGTIVEDFGGPLQGDRRAARGGDFECEVASCRTAARRAFVPEYRFRGLGFRVAVTVIGDDPPKREVDDKTPKK